MYFIDLVVSYDHLNETTGVTIIEACPRGDLLAC